MKRHVVIKGKIYMLREIDLTDERNKAQHALCACLACNRSFITSKTVCACVFEFRGVLLSSYVGVRSASNLSPPLDETELKYGAEIQSEVHDVLLPRTSDTSREWLPRSWFAGAHRSLPSPPRSVPLYIVFVRQYSRQRL